jgi:O-succinylbenzoate synthase
MRLLCHNTPVPIALDEELIGFFDDDEKRYLLETIQPQYIILKPGLLGGFEVCDTWISIAQAGNIGYWLTSALETNVGLNAIANYAYLQQLTLQQGLGTGQLFHNNIPSPLSISNAQLANDPTQKWDLHKIDDCLM